MEDWDAAIYGLRNLHDHRSRELVVDALTCLMYELKESGFRQTLFYSIPFFLRKIRNLTQNGMKMDVKN